MSLTPCIITNVTDFSALLIIHLFAMNIFEHTFVNNLILYEKFYSVDFVSGP